MPCRAKPHPEGGPAELVQLFFPHFFLSAPFPQRAQRRVFCSFRQCFYSVKMAVTAAKEEVDYTIKPEAGANNINTADWPLLLKNYEKRMSN